MSSVAYELGGCVVCGSLESDEIADHEAVRDEVEALSFDAVAIWNTFDQLPDPRRAAAVAHRLLIPGGMFAVRVPNGAFYARVRSMLGGPFRGLAHAILAHNNLLTFPYRHGRATKSRRRLLHELLCEPLCREFNRIHA